MVGFDRSLHIYGGAMITQSVGPSGDRSRSGIQGAFLTEKNSLSAQGASEGAVIWRDFPASGAAARGLYNAAHERELRAQVPSRAQRLSLDHRQLRQASNQTEQLDIMTASYKCAFSQTLMGGQFGCRRALPVSGRDGPEIGCDDEAAHRACAALRERLTDTALPALGYAEGMEVPHSVPVKIQFGGLLGLQRLLGGAAEGGPTEGRVDDVCALVDRAVSHFGSLDGVPYDQLIDAIAGYQLKRRRGR